MKALLVASTLVVAAAPIAACTPPPGVSCHAAVDAYFPPAARARFHRIVQRESRGIATAANRHSSASGCAQLLRCHAGRFRKLGYSWAADRFRAGPNIQVAYDLWLEQGWRPWALTA